MGHVALPDNRAAWTDRELAAYGRGLSAGIAERDALREALAAVVFHFGLREDCECIRKAKAALARAERA